MHGENLNYLIILTILLLLRLLIDAEGSASRFVMVFAIDFTLNK